MSEATEIDKEISELSEHIPVVKRLAAEKADLESRLADVSVRLAEARQIAKQKVTEIKAKLEKK